MISLFCNLCIYIKVLVGVKSFFIFFMLSEIHLRPSVYILNFLILFTYSDWFLNILNHIYESCSPEFKKKWYFAVCLYKRHQTILMTSLQLYKAMPAYENSYQQRLLVFRTTNDRITFSRVFLVQFGNTCIYIPFHLDWQCCASLAFCSRTVKKSSAMIPISYIWSCKKSDDKSLYFFKHSTWYTAVLNNSYI